MWTSPGTSWGHYPFSHQTSFKALWAAGKLVGSGGIWDVLRLHLHTMAWAPFGSCCSTGTEPSVRSGKAGMELGRRRQLQFQSELRFLLSITLAACRDSSSGLKKIWTPQKYCWADMKCSGLCVQSDLFCTCSSVARSIPGELWIHSFQSYIHLFWFHFPHSPIPPFLLMQKKVFWTCVK